MKKQNNIDCLYSKGEIKINPDIKFYDVEQSKLNPFTEMITTKLMRLLKLV
jgi:hypothetical protein